VRCYGSAREKFANSEHGQASLALSQEKKEQKIRANPELSARRLAKHRQWKYGISPEAQAAMLLAQGNCCAGCKVSFDECSSHLDHNHRTNKVRGFLCQPCNQAAGLLRDDPDRAMMLAAYLRKHAETEETPDENQNQKSSDHCRERGPGHRDCVLRLDRTA